MNNQLNSKHSIYYILLALIIVSLSYYFINHKNSIALKDSSYTNGKVISFVGANFSYIMEYEYFVNGKSYRGLVTSMQKFYCADSITLGCIGFTFKVKYSNQKPDISTIDLLGYNRNKSYLLR